MDFLIPQQSQHISCLVIAQYLNQLEIFGNLKALQEPTVLPDLVRDELQRRIPTSPLASISFVPWLTFEFLKESRGIWKTSIHNIE